MDNYISTYILKTDKSILYKIGYIASYEEVTKQKLINQLIKDYVKNFEINNPDIHIPPYKGKDS